MASKSLPKVIYRANSTWKDAVKRLTVSAILKGFKAIDTADLPNSNTKKLVVGEALEQLYEKHGKKREDLWLQTKFIPVGDQGYKDGYYYQYDHKAPISSQIRESLQTSLSNLHTSYVDSYILHDPLHMVEPSMLLRNPGSLWDDDAVRRKIYTAWKELGALRDEGTVRAIGVSNCYNVDVLKALVEERKVDVVQNVWSGLTGWDKGVVAYCRENGIMYQALWPPRNAPSLVKNAQDVARILRCKPAQVVLRVAQANGITPLSGTTTILRNIVAAENLNLDTSGFDERLETLQKLFFK